MINMYKYILALLFPVFAFSQTTKTIKVNVAGYGDCNVVLSYPAGLPSGKNPATVFVTGNGEVGTSVSKLYVYGPLAYKPSGIISIGAQPLSGFAGAPFLNAVLKELVKPEYNISSFNLTGLSGGAGAVISYMAQASIPVMPSSVVLFSFNFDDGPVNANYAKVATWLLCGTGDGGHYTSMLKSYNQLKAWGYNVRATWYSGGHSGWNTYYNPTWKENGTSIYDFMIASAKAAPVVQPPVTDPPITQPPTTPPVTPPVTNSPTRKVFVGTGNGVYIKSGVNPGDTVELKGNFTYFSFDSLKGTVEKPIVFVNNGRVWLERGFGMNDVQNIKIVGSAGYGFFIQGIEKSGSGVSIGRHSSNIEISGVEIANKNYGFWIKNEADCDVTLNYPNWTLDNIKVHDCYIRQMDSQGFYMGSTDPNNLDRSITCNGVTRNYAPTRLGNIKIYNNIIDSTGRPGIQLSGAMTGNNEIYGNKISNCGLQYDDAQGTGISLGGYTRAYVHDNIITNTYTWGIASLGGSGLVRIENNTINNSGWVGTKSTTWATNIAVDTRTTSPVDSTTFKIKNNKLGAHTHPSLNMTVADLRRSMSKIGNEICNNTIGTSTTLGKFEVETGIVYSTCGTTTPPVVIPPVTPIKTVSKIITITIYTDGTSKIE